MRGWPYVAAAALLGSLTSFIDPDLYWHLSVGRWVAEHGLPSTNIFSHTYPDFPWRYTEWLYGTGLYLIWKLAGWPGLTVFQAILVVATFLLVLGTCRRSHPNGDITLTVALVVFAVQLCQFRFNGRPELMSFLLLALVANLWTRHSRRETLWMLAVGTLWANVHPGFVFGMAYLAAQYAGALLKREAREGRRALIAAVAFSFGTLLSPSGYASHLYSLGHLYQNATITVSEMTFARPLVYPWFYLLAFAGLVAAVVRLREGRIQEALTESVLLPMAVLFRRNIPLYVIVALPGISEILSRGTGRLCRTERGRWLSVLIVAPLLGYVLWNASRTLLPHDTRHGWGLGFHEEELPKRLVSFIRDNGLEGRLYNDLATGDYLLWALYPRPQVFQDSRLQAYPFSFLGELYRDRSLPTFARQMNEHRVELAVVRRVFEGGRVIPCEAMHFEAMGWPLVYRGGHYLLYVRPGWPPGRGLPAFTLVTWGRSCDELLEMARIFPDRVAEEVRRIDPETLDLGAEYRCLGLTAVEAGDPLQAEKIFNSGLSAHPEDHRLRFERASLLLSTRPDEAVRELRRVMRDGAGTPSEIQARHMLAVAAKAVPSQ